MRFRALCLIAILSSLSLTAAAQTNAIASSSGELPLLSCIGAGILAGGVLSIFKTRHQK